MPKHRKTESNPDQSKKMPNKNNNKPAGIIQKYSLQKDNLQNHNLQKHYFQKHNLQNNSLQKFNHLVQKYIPYLLAGLIPLSLIAVFVYAPRESVMGDVQRIFYYHVGSAWVGFFAFFLVFIASIQYLRSENNYWTRLARASAEIGVIFTTFVLLSGMLWARPTWNTWWTWDPRLTTSLILWLMYLAYLFLSQTLKGEEKNSQSRLTAIFGIIAFVNVPLVFMSIRWWRTIHPVVIEIGGTGLSPRMIQVLIFSVITISLLYYQLLLMRLNQLNNQVRLHQLMNKMRRQK